MCLLEKTKEYKFSIIYLTYRPGGFDLLVEGLRTQTYKNYELIIIDDYPNRDLTKYLTSRDIPLTYYSSSKEPQYKENTYGIANAINTGLMRASGDILLLLMDYAYLRPNALQRWNDIFVEKGMNTLISGIGKEYNTSEQLIIDPVSAWAKPFTGDLSRFHYFRMWKPTLFEIFYSGFPMKFFEEINGVDERADVFSEWTYYSLVAQANLLGYEFHVDEENVVDLINHRGWMHGDARLWFVARVGIPRPSKMIPWFVPSPNNFNLEEIRGKARVQDYWRNRVLYSWGSYEEMRALRYDELHTYMPEVFEFDGFAGKKVLDAGCGGGIDSVEFAKNGADVYAIDLTEESAQRTRELADTLSLDIKVDKADLCELSYPDEFFDHVHCFGVLHHIPDVDAAVGEIHRVLKRGGTAYVMLYNRDSVLYYYSLLFQRGIEQKCFDDLSVEEVISRFSEAKEGCPYTRVYTREEAKRLFSQFGRVTVETHYNVYDTLEQRKIKFNGPLELGWHLVVKAGK